ncbi:24444_t:CDS:2 [Dentiscutata erythropus]|uniref:24444_t:CDS:1 n=1 Tax=Dentiscutata erythropus TaxID=1348616 RepID=A0A9N9HU06_9GLOM|nr:24444_t:CDS:2 [Dentiscutata erythropus]
MDFSSTFLPRDDFPSIIRAKNEAIILLQQRVIELHEELLESKCELLKIKHEQNNAKDELLANSINRINRIQRSITLNNSWSSWSSASGQSLSDDSDELNLYCSVDSSIKTAKLKYMVWVGNVVPPITQIGLRSRLEEEFGTILYIEKLKFRPCAFVYFSDEGGFYKALEVGRLIVQGQVVRIERPRAKNRDSMQATDSNLHNNDLDFIGELDEQYDELLPDFCDLKERVENHEFVFM